jgi:paraquat-inducible protein B
MLEANKFKLGVFVASGILLIILSFFIHGLANNFKDKTELFTIFDESVQGLDIGSEVKYKGITLGSVTNIYLWEDQYVRVDMEIIPGAGNKNKKSIFENSSEQEKAKKIKEFIQDQKHKGFSCELSMSGITGLKFIEFDHVEDPKNLFEMDLKEENYIPCRKSLLTGTIMSLDEALSKIASVDFQGISDEIKNTLVSFRETYANDNIKGAVNDIRQTTKGINQTFTAIKTKVVNGEFDSTVKMVNDTLNGIKQLANSMNKELKNLHLAKISQSANSTLESSSAAAKQLRKSVASIEDQFNKTLTEIQVLAKEATKIRHDLTKASSSIGGEASEIKTDIHVSLNKLNQALESIQALFQMLEKDPSALIQGKSQ